MSKFKVKEYIFNFVGGGWNTEWAKTKRGAIALARGRYKGNTVCVPDFNSFRLSTPESYNANLATFY